MSGADFANALFLDRATIDNLRGALLGGCNLHGVPLGGCDLSGSDVAGASFAGATCETPCALARARGLETYPIGTVESVRAGSLVALDGVLLAVTADHPANAAYAYFATYETCWARASLAGCFEKRHCRVLAS